MSTKLKNESLLLKEAIRVGLKYAEKRGVASFEGNESQHTKIEYIYRLLVHDKLIQPLPKDQEKELNMRHKLALWISRQLPEGYELLR